MNKVQHISRERFGPVLITENPIYQPHFASVIEHQTFEHPILDTASFKAQQKVASVQGKRGLSFAGAYLNWGFHEDGFTSGLLAVMQSIGDDVKPPFPIQVMEGSVWEFTPGVVVRRHHQRAGKLDFLPSLFLVLEKSGIRVVFGYVFGWLLDLMLWMVTRCFHVGFQ